MPIVVLDVTTELSERAGALMALVGKDPTPSASPAPPPYVGPLREALASLGIVPASFGAITDADLAAVADKDVSQLVDVAELILVRGVSGAFTSVDETLSLSSTKDSQNRSSIEARWKGLADLCRERYGYGLGRLTSGGIRTATRDPHRYSRHEL